LAASLKEMTIKLEILKTKLRAGSVISLIAFVICSVFLFFDIYLPGYWNWAYALVYILSVVGMIILPIIFHNYEIIGCLIIDNSKIRIAYKDHTEKEYLFGEIKQLRFELNETAVDGGYSIKFGINNNIYITDLNNEVFKFKVKVNNSQVVRFIDDKLDKLKKYCMIIKIRKGNEVNSLVIK
jgi:hypothetical protein